MFPRAIRICETKAHKKLAPALIAVGTSSASPKGSWMKDLAKLLWSNEEGQDIAEYAVMLAVILVLVIGTVKLIGTNANNVFSQVASSIQ
jgi:Flp pilus assembly pilin Flp